MSLESNLAAEERESQQRLRPFVVLNPRSGSCTVADVRRAIREHLGGREAEVHEVAPGDDLPGLIRSALSRGCDPIVAAGGDGTVSSVANLLVGTEAHLVILPLGTANVLARELGIPVDLEGSCRLGGHCIRLGSLAGAEHGVSWIDAMKVGDRHYFTQVGVGIDALMIRDTKTAAKRRFGRMAYLWTAATRLVGFQPRRFTLTVDDRRYSKKASQVVVANSGMMGQPGLRWGPDIKVDDGRLDVCVVRARNAFNYLEIFWRVVRASHRQSPHVRYLVAERSVVIETKHPLPVQADGEILGDTPVRVEIVPRAVRVVVPLAV